MRRSLREVIAEDTGLGSEESTMLAFGLMGMAQLERPPLAARETSIDRERAAELVSRMGWRGISGFPPPANDPPVGRIRRDA